MAETTGCVVVVDDDEAVRRALKFSLELEGLAVTLHGSGQDMLDAPPAKPGGCLVVDYYMPGMTGIELVERLRDEDRVLPAILITGRADPEIRARAEASGIALVLEKPLEDAALLDGIRAALARSSPEQPA